MARTVGLIIKEDKKEEIKEEKKVEDGKEKEKVETPEFNKKFK